MQPLKPFEFRQVRDLGDVLNATFVFIKQNLAPLAKSLLLIVAPFMALTSVAGASLQSTLLNLDPTNPEALRELFGLSYFATVFFSLLASLMSMLVVYGYIERYQEQGPGGIGVDLVWRIVRQRFMRLLGTLLSLVLLLFMFYLGFFFIVILLAFILGPLLGGLLGAFMAVAVVLALVYVFITFTLVFPMRMFEAVSLPEAFRRCLYLVKGYWLPTFGVIFLALLIYTILGTMFNTPALIFSFVHGLHSTDAGDGGGVYRLLMIIAGVVGGVGTSLLYAIPLVATALQYFSLIERKEKVGLMQRIERISEAAEEGGDAPDTPTY
jgi:hypothetical protein